MAFTPPKPPRVYRTKRRAGRLKGVEIFEADPCAYCGRPGEHYDHIEPLAKGGTNTLDNITRACGSCNFDKGQIPLLRFLVKQAAARRAA